MNEKKLILIKKGLFLITILLALSNMVILIFFKDHVNTGNMIFRFVQYIAMLLVLIAPQALRKWFQINVPLGLYIVIALFAFNALVLGDALNFYGRYTWWDSVLHFHSGIILSFVGLWLIYLIMEKNSKYIYLNKYFLSLFIIMFSLGMGALWEIGEYTCDGLFHTNSQQYMKTTSGTMISNQDIPLQGHDALTDTIKDLALDLGGSVVVAVYGFVRHEKFKKNIIER